MSWVLFALIAALFQAGFVEANRPMKAKAAQLNFLHVAGGLALSIPLLPWMIFPEDPVFYAAFVIIGAISVVGCMMQMHMSSQKNGRVASMWMPVSTFSGFFLWLVVDPSLAQSYLGSFVTMGGIAVAFLICSMSLSSMRRNDDGWRSFLIVAPVGVLYGLNGVIIKYIMPETPEMGHLLTYNLMYYAVAVIMQAFVLVGMRQMTPELVQRHMMKGGLVVALCSFITGITIVKAITLASNPAYAGMVMMTVPVWLMIYHKAVGVRDDADPKSGLMLVAGALLLAMVTA